MYTMLLEEIQWALEESEPYEFTHYLIFSKVYTEVESKLDTEENGPAKKKKRKGQDGGEGETFYFHPEDEVLHKFAEGFGSFEYTKETDEGAADAKRAFADAGIVPKGHLILIEAATFESAVKALVEYMKP
jgi:protein BCP1